MTSFAEFTDPRRRDHGLGRRVDAAPFTCLDQYALSVDRSALIVSGAVAVMAPGAFEAATAVLSPGAVVALDGMAAPGDPAQLCCVSRVEARMLSLEALEDEPDAGRRIHGAEVRTLAELHRHAQQAAVCVLRHPLQQRLAGWLLALREAIQADELRLGHATLARIIGAQRTTVTAGLSELARAGAVRSGRNRVMIVDADKLAAHSCGCPGCVG